MTLDDAQKSKVAEWIKQGLKLSEIQNRISSEMGLRLTYMDVRLLVDDLKLTPKDAESVKTPDLAPASPPSGPSSTAAKGAPIQPTPGNAAPAKGKVSVSVDQITRPGALVSGKVTFSDGNRADWYLDQTGRLGLAPQQAGYRPAPADVQDFQIELESELARMGFA